VSEAILGAAGRGDADGEGGDGYVDIQSAKTQPYDTIEA
jgi:hypothetical protein